MLSHLLLAKIILPLKTSKPQKMLGKYRFFFFLLKFPLSAITYLLWVQINSNGLFPFFWTKKSVQSTGIDRFENKIVYHYCLYADMFMYWYKQMAALWTLLRLWKKCFWVSPGPDSFKLFSYLSFIHLLDDWFPLSIEYSTSNP